MKLASILRAACAIALLSCGTTISFALDASGPAMVIDSDTLEIGATRVRVFGIDAPEKGQRCIGPGRKIIRAGEIAANRLAELFAGGVSCTSSELDKYGRLIAHCRVGTPIDLGRVLVDEGLAWAFVRYSSYYVADEAAARADGRGIWKLACDAPWDFRAKRWSSAIQRA